MPVEISNCIRAIKWGILIDALFFAFSGYKVNCLSSLNSMKNFLSNTAPIPPEGGQKKPETGDNKSPAGGFRGLCGVKPISTINYSSLISHDSKIGDYCDIAPNVKVLG